MQGRALEWPRPLSGGAPALGGPAAALLPVTSWRTGNECRAASAACFPLQPCPMCYTACMWAHIDHVYYGATYDDVLQYGR